MSCYKYYDESLKLQKIDKAQVLIGSLLIVGGLLGLGAGSLIREYLEQNGGDDYFYIGIQSDVRELLNRLDQVFVKSSY